jgi:hypothetical protein
VHQVQITLDAVAAASMAPRNADPGLIIKTALTEALAGPVVRPWRLHQQNGRDLMVLGYSELAESVLRERLALSQPRAQRAVRSILSSPMPAEIAAGTEVRYRIRLCPTIRVTPGGARPHGERDAYLVAADAAGPDANLSRVGVYGQYLRDRVSGVELCDFHLDGFRLERMRRNGVRSFPVAECYGTAKVTDWAALVGTLSSGIGRQRAFGCGYLRLEAAK